MNVKEVNKRNQYGETAVHRAAKAGNLVRLTACLATPGVDINCRDNNGYTALHEAVQQVNHNYTSIRVIVFHYESYFCCTILLSDFYQSL